MTRGSARPLADERALRGFLEGLPSRARLLALARKELGERADLNLGVP